MSKDVGISITGLDPGEMLDTLPDAIRQARGEMLENIGKQLLGDVQRRIGGSGRLAGRQEYQLGSGRGYVAVRPKSGTMEDGYAIGYVTAALEHGHPQQAGRYVPALGAALVAPRVEGKFMYYGTEHTEAATKATSELVEFDRQIERHLKGGEG